MNKPSRKQIEAIVGLKNNEAFRVVIGWIAESMNSSMTQSLSLDKEPQRSWMQGRAQEMAFMLDTIAKAEDTLNEMQAQGHPGNTQQQVFL